MREIISVYLGQAGVQIGGAVCDLLSFEHGVAGDGSAIGDAAQSDFERTLNDFSQRVAPAGECCRAGARSRSTVFSELEGAKFVPRAVFADTDVGALDGLRARGNGRFAAEQFVHGYADSGGLWAAAAGPSAVREGLFAQIRAQLEEADSPQGLLVFGAAGGGSGGGLASAALEHARDALRLPCPAIAVSVWPAAGHAGGVLEPYNAVLGLGAQIDCADLTAVVDNTGLARVVADVDGGAGGEAGGGAGGEAGSIASKARASATGGKTSGGQAAGGETAGGIAAGSAARSAAGSVAGSYCPINTAIAAAAGSWSASLRFPGPLNFDLHELATNLVPFPSLHFVLPSFAQRAATAPVAELTAKLFDARHALFDDFQRRAEPERPVLISCSVMFRGAASLAPGDVSASLCRLRSAGAPAVPGARFVDWCPTGFKCSISGMPAAGAAGTGAAPLDFSCPRAFSRFECRPGRHCASALFNAASVKEHFLTVAERFDTMISRGAYLHKFEAAGCGVEDLMLARQKLAELTHDYANVDFGTLRPSVETEWEGFEGVNFTEAPDDKIPQNDLATVAA